MHTRVMKRKKTRLLRNLAAPALPELHRLEQFTSLHITVPFRGVLAHAATLRERKHTIRRAPSFNGISLSKSAREALPHADGADARRKGLKGTQTPLSLLRVQIHLGGKRASLRALSYQHTTRTPSPCRAGLQITGRIQDAAARRHGKSTTSLRSAPPSITRLPERDKSGHEEGRQVAGGRAGGGFSVWG